MGNCLVLLQEKPVSVMKTDGKIIEYKSPIKVHQVLSQFSHHALSDKLPVVKHLHPNTEMLQGHLYYLLPLPVAPQPTEKKKKTVRFSEDIVEKEEKKRASGVVRIKLVITKQELQAILRQEGVSVEDMLSQVQKEPIKIGDINEDDGNICLKGWLPALESIPELD